MLEFVPMSRSLEGFQRREEAYNRLLATDKGLADDPWVVAFRKVLSPNAPPNRAEDIVRAIFNISTETARSEAPASDEQNEEIYRKVGIVEQWMWEFGRPPVGEELEIVDESALVYIDDVFWLAVEEESEPPYDFHVDPTKLYAEVRDETGAKVRYALGHDERYQLEIEFYRDREDSKKRTAVYNSGVSPIRHLAENEAVIIMGILDDFISFQGISSSTSLPSQ